ncbi:UNVERIFIED_CONTAM: hypothetical protein FKN15_069600 [Acipenser sinensis]
MQRKLEKLRESQSALESEAEARRRTKEEAEALGQEAKEKHRSAWNELQAAKRKEQEFRRKLEKLQESQRALESEAEARRRTKEEAEALGQKAKEKHRSAWNELQAAKRKEQESQHVAKLFVELDSDHSGVISSPEVQARSELDGDTDGTVTETEARSAPVQVPDFDETTQAVIDGVDINNSATVQPASSEIWVSEPLSNKCCGERAAARQYSPVSHGSDTESVWGSWAGSEENKYSMMKFEDGAACWQGPYRSVQVKLVCGEQTAVMSSAEPSRCEYLFELQTPAACNQPAPALKHEEL